MNGRTLLWATDVHLDHLPHPNAAAAFGEALSNEVPHAEALIVTGDIGEAPTVARILTDLQSGLGLPVYFVLGNHDYYRSTFRDVDALVHDLCQDNEQLHWLHEESAALSEKTLLVGCNGWYDARFGDRRTDLQLTDFSRIGELFDAQYESREALLAACAARADADASMLDNRLATLAANVRNVIVATHVPPFQAAAWHDGKPSDEHWAPFFSSRVIGEVLSKHAARLPSVQFTVLCGHTHGAGTHAPRDNLVVHTGRARYGAPELAGFVALSKTGVRVSPFEP